MSLTKDKVVEELRSLNEQFHSESLEPKGLFHALRQLGIEPMHSILISLYPDSGSTWCGELFDESMGPVEFDVDLADYANSTVQALCDDMFRSRRGQILRSAVLEIRAELEEMR